MRWVIAGSAFFAPLLLTVAIGSCFVDAPVRTGDAKPSLAPAAMDELYRFIQGNLTLLQQYAVKPGQPDSRSIPHLALDRFDMRGIDGQGHPWYRLARPPPGTSCGVLLRAADDLRPAGPIGGHPVVVVLPLAGPWCYWETKPPVAGAAKSP